MNSYPTRRQVLGLLASGSIPGIAGCLDNSEESLVSESSVDCDPAEYPSPASEIPDGAWVSRRGNKQRTGANLDVDPLQLNHTETFHAEDLFVRERVSLPAVSDGAIYVTSKDDQGITTDAVDIETGEIHWSRQTGADAPPLLTRDSVYVPGPDGSIHALTRDSGEPRWSVDLDAPGWVVPPAVIVPDKIVLGQYNDRNPKQGRVVALDLQCGSERWSFGLGPDRPAWVSTDGDIVYVATSSEIYALNPTDGTQEWRIGVPDYALKGPPATANDMLFFTTGTEVYAVSAKDGTEQWTTRDELSIEYPPTVSDETVFIVDNPSGDAGPRIVALDSETGQHRWEFSEVKRILSEPTYLPGTLYVASVLPNPVGAYSVIQIDEEGGGVVGIANIPYADSESFTNINPRFISELAVTTDGIFIRSSPETSIDSESPDEYLQHYTVG